MQKTLKILSYIGKAVGFLGVIDVTAVSPKYGAIIFFAASMLKDSVNRIGDFLDDGKANNSFKDGQ